MHRTHDDLAGLAEKWPDVDVLREMMQFMGLRLLESTSKARRRLGYDEKSPRNPTADSRNGFRERVWETSVAAWEPSDTGRSGAMSAVASCPTPVVATPRGPILCQDRGTRHRGQSAMLQYESAFFLRHSPHSASSTTAGTFSENSWAP